MNLDPKGFYKHAQDQAEQKHSKSTLIDGLEADKSSVELPDLLLEKAELYSGEMSMFLRGAALKVLALESAARQIVEAAETKDMRLLERGINGLKILGF